MKRVAIVFEEDIFNQKGTFHAKLERVRHLAARPELEVEVFCVQVRYTWIERLLLGKRWLDGVSERRLGRPERLDFDGVSYRMLWMPYSILDHFLFFKLGRRPLFYPRFLFQISLHPRRDRFADGPRKDEFLCQPCPVGNV